MPATGENGHVVRFGVFDLDLKAAELRRNGSKVRLQEQPFQVLTVLIEQPGEVVTREQLRARLWPSDTFVDFDHSLNTAVRRLRDALGDSAENPRFVETVARRGYRFLAPVSKNGVLSVAPAPANHTRWAVGAVAAGAAAVLLMSGILIGFRAGSRSERKLTPQVLQRRLTANPEDDPILSATISPDGRYLAFADHTGFYLQQVDTGETHTVPLPKDSVVLPANWAPQTIHGIQRESVSSEGFAPKPASWFPDSTHLIATWVRGPEDPPSLWEISVLGGEPRKLVDDGWRPAVSPDGSQIAFVRGSEKGENEMWVMGANGEQPHQVQPPDGSYGSYYGTPAWDPDSQSIAFARSVYVPGLWNAQIEIDQLNVVTRKRRALLSASGLGPALGWTADGRLIYSLDEPPPNQTDSNLWSVRVDAHTSQVLGPPVRITSQAGPIADISVSKDAKRLAITRRTFQPDVYIAPIHDHGEQLGEPRRLTLDERSDIPYSWTPDGRSVIFISDRYGTFNIFKQGIDDPTPEVLVGGKDPLAIPRLSPDGSEIFYLIQPKVGDSSANVRLMRVPLSGGAPQQILEAPGIINQQCARSPSTLCLFGQMITRTQMRIFSFDPKGGKGKEIEKARIDNEDAYSFNWSLSPDGRTLAMAKKLGLQREAGIRLISIEDGTERFLPVRGWPGIVCLDWAADGKSIWAVAYTTTEPRTLLNVELQGRVRAVLQEKKMVLGWAIPSPDGRELAIWKASGGSNVWLVENF